MCSWLWLGLSIAKLHQSAWPNFYEKITRLILTFATFHMTSILTNSNTHLKSGYRSRILIVNCYTIVAIDKFYLDLGGPLFFGSRHFLNTAKHSPRTQCRCILQTSSQISSNRVNEVQVDIIFKSIPFHLYYRRHHRAALQTSGCRFRSLLRIPKRTTERENSLRWHEEKTLWGIKGVLQWGSE